MPGVWFCFWIPPPPHPPRKQVPSRLLPLVFVIEVNRYEKKRLIFPFERNRLFNKLTGVRKRGTTNRVTLTLGFITRIDGFSTRHAGKWLPESVASVSDDDGLPYAKRRHFERARKPTNGLRSSFYALPPCLGEIRTSFRPNSS